MPRQGVAKIPPESERRFQDDYVIPLARLRGWRVYHTHDSRRSPAGFPDLFMVRFKRLVAAELKSQRGKITVDQKLWLMSLSAAGIETYVWRPEDRPEIAAVLK